MINTEEIDQFSYLLRNVSAKQEYVDPIKGELSGTIPKWIRGTFLKNGPAKFEVGDTKYNHLFDGLAMLQKYIIEDGEVIFQSRYLQSDTYKRNMAANRIVVSEFGTLAFPDPCKNIFWRYASYFIPDIFKMTDNASVNVIPIHDGVFAVTETTLLSQIDVDTLERIEKHDLQKYISVNLATAHPHFGTEDKSVHNLGSSYGRRPQYALICMPPPDAEAGPLQKTKLAATINCRWPFHPSYSHSFGMTENYYIVVESPMTISLPNFIAQRVLKLSICQVLKYFDEEQTCFRVVDKRTGKELNRRYVADAFFMFHQGNAYEEDGNIIFDMACYKDGSIMTNLNLSDYVSKETRSNYSYYRRYVIPLPSNDEKDKSNTTPTIFCDYKLMCEQSFEFPTINYRQYNTKKYRYVYGMTTGDNSRRDVIKVDLSDGSFKLWGEEDCAAGEPIFIPKDSSSEEDDGVLICSFIRIKGENRSQFLVFLDGKNLEEIGRAEFPSVSIPAGFHGLFFPEQG